MAKKDMEEGLSSSRCPLEMFLSLSSKGRSTREHQGARLARPSRSSFRSRTTATTDAPPPLTCTLARRYVLLSLPRLSCNTFLSLSKLAIEGAHASSRNFACVVPGSMVMLRRRPWQPALRG
jgi:hypothetical protein